jgi:hypothetical protein
MLNKIKNIARKAFLIKFSAEENSIATVIESFIRIKVECCQLRLYKHWHIISVLNKNIGAALKQKVNAAVNYLKLKKALDLDYSIEVIKKEVAMRKATQNEFKDYAKKLYKNSCMFLVTNL